MLRKIKLQNSTILFIGIMLIVSGFLIGFFDYFKGKKDKAFSDMNILLYENEIPSNVDSDDEIKEQTEQPEQPEPPDTPEGQPVETEKPKPKTYTYNYVGILEIPKINLKRGFLDIDSKYNNVNYNITVISGSTFPDEDNNNLILAAHSGNCSICFFDKLYKLSLGDVAYVTYKNEKHSYKIVDIYNVPKTGSVSIYRDYSKNVLTLITCTRNSNTEQTVYILEEYS